MTLSCASIAEIPHFIRCLHAKLCVQKQGWSTSAQKGNSTCLLRSAAAAADARATAEARDTAAALAAVAARARASTTGVKVNDPADSSSLAGVRAPSSAFGNTLAAGGGVGWFKLSRSETAVCNSLASVACKIFTLEWRSYGFQEKKTVKNKRLYGK